jgi:hypothetical protein
MINSIAFQLFKEELKNKEEYTRHQIRYFCKNNDYKGALLNLYNKTYSFTPEALSDYIAFKLPKKYLSMLLNNF